MGDEARCQALTRGLLFSTMPRHPDPIRTGWVTEEAGRRGSAGLFFLVVQSLRYRTVVCGCSVSYRFKEVEVGEEDGAGGLVPLDDIVTDPRPILINGLECNRIVLIDSVDREVAGTEAAGMVGVESDLESEVDIVTTP